MGDVIEKMLDEVPDGLFGFEVFLPAFVAVSAEDLGLAVEAVGSLSFV
jgi:hypothetical protein